MDLKKRKDSMTRCVGRPKKQLDRDSRYRRDIANNHERKRMQSINDGIQALRRILRHKDIEKLSKATVLLRSAEYIIHLEKELSLMNEQNFKLKYLSKQLIHNKFPTSLAFKEILIGGKDTFVEKESINETIDKNVEYIDENVMDLSNKSKLLTN